MAFRPRGNRLGYDSTGRRGGPTLTLQDGTGDTNHKQVMEPKIITVPLDDAMPATGQTVFIADDGRAWTVVAISEVHTVAEVTAAKSNLKVERCQGIQAATEGDDLLAATDIDLKAAANTTQPGTVLTASGINTLANGDRLVMHTAADTGTAGVLTEYVGSVQITLTPTTLLDVATS